MSFDSFHSPRSGSTSKRSFSSLGTSARKSSNNPTKKTKKNNQKTLGMAWGSNSLSSSKSSFSNSPFPDFGSYMVVKNKKLQEQFNAEASSSSHSSNTSEKPIFHGVSIFVDGYTVPSSQELRGYMLKHGGHFENYFSRHRVTHIICSNLPDSKIKKLRSFSHGLPVVIPTWVLDSVAANKLLSWAPYQLEQLACESSNQPKLLAFFTPKRISVCHDRDPYLNGGDLATDVIDLSSKDAKQEHLENTSEDGAKSDDLTHEKSTEVILGELSCSTNSHCEVGLVERRDISAFDKSCSGVEPQCIPCETILPDCSYLANDKTTGETSTSSIAGPSNHFHSTLMDPNFVENYFKNSRLHFIGTWRNRYRKLFPGFYNGLNHNSMESFPAALRKTIVIHVDMDCFFVSAVIRNHPELQNKPVAICHSDNPRGTAEISSANYPARDRGVRSGMFVRDAKALCPHLIIFPYNFEAYEKVADDFYSILHKHCNKVQAVSCDEAFLDVTDSEVEDPQVLASIIRKKIFDTTGCTASAGIAGTMLMARLATRTAKPDGQFYIPPDKVEKYLQELPIKALPGIGRNLEEKLNGRHIETCGQLSKISKESLQRDFGSKVGEMLWNYSRGVDIRQVGAVQRSKSIGAEVNWGVRFKHMEDCQTFLMDLCKEVSLRLRGCGVQGRTFTLKIKKRRNGAEEPIKYMGCGDCENFSHSMTVPLATNEVGVLQRVSTQLFGLFGIDINDIRGMGLQVSRLEHADGTKQARQRNTIHSWLISSSTSGRQGRELDLATKAIVDKDIHKQSSGLSPNLSEASVQMGATLPSFCDLDIRVIESLPDDIISEINDMYGGKLMNMISRNKGKTLNIFPTVDSKKGEGNGTKGSCSTNMESSSKINEETLGASCSETGTSSMVMSLNQDDTLILQPMPVHSRSEKCEDFAEEISSARPNLLNSPSVKHSTVRIGSSGTSVRDNLWLGHPPLWVHTFKDKGSWILNNFVEIHNRLGPTSCLSSILQCSLLEVQVPQKASSSDLGDDSIHSLCELFKQYIEYKLETDIEEIYICFRLLKRLCIKSKFYLQVYDTILPYLQACVCKIYGGNLDI